MINIERSEIREIINKYKGKKGDGSSSFREMEREIGRKRIEGLFSPDDRAKLYSHYKREG